MSNNSPLTNPRENLIIGQNYIVQENLPRGTLRFSGTFDGFFSNGLFALFVNIQGETNRNQAYLHNTIRFSFLNDCLFYGPSRANQTAGKLRARRKTRKSRGRSRKTRRRI